MDDPRLRQLIAQLRASRFADVKGARASISIPISERLLNELIGAAVPPSAPVRDVHVQPQAGNRFSVRARLKKSDLLPPFTLKLAIERQPELPSSPLVLRLLTLPGLLSLAGSALPLHTMLPPGVRMQDDRVLIDLPLLLQGQGLADLVPFIETLRVGTDEGRLMVELSLRV